MGVLRSLNDERFCQLVVAGTDPEEAYKVTGGTAKNTYAAGQRKLDNETIRKRITELMEQAARKAQLSRMDIITRMVDDWDTCRKLGQMGPAATNARLLGSELHGMFIERKEIGGPGDFDKKTAEELLSFIKDGLAELGTDAKEIMAEVNKLGINLEDGVVLLPPAPKSDLDDNQAN